jgi:signal peptidase II
VGSVTLPGGFGELRLAENPGSFLSLGAFLPDTTRFAIFTFGVGVGLFALFVYLTICAQIHVVRFIGLSLVMAGGMSNLVDRIFHHGLMTDFVTIHLGPLHTGVFNAADILIMIGVAAIICTFRKKALPNRPTNQMQRTGR